MYVEPRKMVQMSQFAGQKLRHRWREWTYGHQGGKTAAAVTKYHQLGGFKKHTFMMNWAIGFDMYTLMCIKWMTNKNLL